MNGSCTNYMIRNDMELYAITHMLHVMYIHMYMCMYMYLVVVLVLLESLGVY